MGLGSLVRTAYRIADGVTKDLQPVVLHEQWIGQKGAGGQALFDPPVPRAAIVEKVQRQVRGPDGQNVMSSTTVHFLRPMAAHGAANRKEPVDPRDRIVEPDGTVGVIINNSGLVDRTTTFPYAHTVFLE